MSLTVNLLYFARLREALGIAQEHLVLPAGVSDVAGLMAALAARGGVWQREFDGAHPLRAAVNQVLAEASTPVSPGDEVAFFPPVTGG